MEKEFIIVSINRNTKRKIFINEILCCEAKNTYTSIKLLNGKDLLISKPLKEMEAELSNHYFYRISRGCMVNMYYAIEINKLDFPKIELIDKSAFRISKSKLRLLEKTIFTKPQCHSPIEKGISHSEKVILQS